MSGALRFLSPSLATDQGDFHPLARSSMERRQRDAGASFEERDGWLIPVSLPAEAERIAAVGIADLSHLGKIEVRTNPASPQEIALASGTSEGIVWYRISRRRTLLFCPTSQTASLLDEIAAERACELALDVSAGLSILAIAGPEAWTVVRRMTHLHHAPSSGEVAHVNSVHLLEVEGALWLVFPQELGHYLWEVAVDRAVPLGGGPIGVDALARAAR